MSKQITYRILDVEQFSSGCETCGCGGRHDYDVAMYEDGVWVDTVTVSCMYDWQRDADQEKLARMFEAGKRGEDYE